MTQFEVEIEELKKELLNMWVMVESQMEKARQSLLTHDKDLAREVMLKEKKRVNAYELKIDRDCENIFALYQPVAVDLRFLLAALKINNNLERVGDIADGIARYVIDMPEPFQEDILVETNILSMFEKAMTVLKQTRVAFENEDTQLARGIFLHDELLDKINLESNLIIANYIKAHPDNIQQALFILSIIRKLERVGDQSTNIAEEIIFYVEAKVLKHHIKRD